MRKLFVPLIAALMLLIGTPANATPSGGSDSPTPYFVTTEGIQLPTPDVFPAHGHVNVKFYSPDDNDPWEQTKNLHFDPNNGHPGGAWIGKAFIPWSAFGIPDGSTITWVQISMYNEHFGEGGQKPIPTGPKPDPLVENRDRLEDSSWVSVPNCSEGEITETRTVTKLWEQRTSEMVWNPESQGWDEVWGEWEITKSEVVNEASRTRLMTDEEIEACDTMPPTGAPLIGAGLLALGLGTGGGYLAFRNRRQSINA